jgi:transcriptional regulator with XRE-family HTH domain
MLTGDQIRAARALLRWSAAKLALESKVAAKTIARFEEAEGVPPSRSSKLMDVKAALEAGGVEFIGSPQDRPGVRLLTVRKTKRELENDCDADDGRSTGFDSDR